MVSSMQTLSAGSLKALNPTSIPLFQSVCRMFPFQFSREFKTLVPLNSDFSAFKLLNSLENSTASSVLPHRDHSIPIDFSHFKLLEINVLSITKNFVTTYFVTNQKWVKVCYLAHNTTLCPKRIIL